MQNVYILTEKEMDQLKTILQCCYVELNQIGYIQHNVSPRIKKQAIELKAEITKARKIIKDMV